MLWGRSYKINDRILEELRSAGMDDLALASLRSLQRNQSYSGNEFTTALAGIGPKKLDEDEQRAVTKLARTSLIGLDRFIPHRGTREWVEALVFAIVIALFVRTFLIAPFKIPSGSMIPTIEVGDHIFATMFNYGVPVPFTEEKLFRSEIQRGDIVIFPYPKNPEMDYIKRVIARGGEMVQVKDNRAFINGKPLDEPYAYIDPREWGRMSARGLIDPGCNFACTAPVRVPDGHLFMMGDNRLNSSDSRVWGFVDEKTVRGRGWIIYFSHNPDAGLFGGYRLGRIASILR